MTSGKATLTLILNTLLSSFNMFGEISSCKFSSYHVSLGTLWDSFQIQLFHKRQETAF